MISINNLSKTYGTATVLSIEHLEIPNGETFGLVGNNGAGKTTLFSLMLDLIQATTGFVSIDGIKVSESEAWKNKVSAFVDDTFLIGYLTPEEYFYFIGELRGQNKASVDEFLKPFYDFFNGEILKSGKYIRDLSKGNQKKQDGVTFLISSHDLSHTTEVCNRIVVVNKGQMVKDIRTNPETLKDLEQYFADQVSGSEIR